LAAVVSRNGGFCNAYDRHLGGPLGGFGAAGRLLLPPQSGRCNSAASAPEIAGSGGSHSLTENAKLKLPTGMAVQGVAGGEVRSLS